MAQTHSHATTAQTSDDSYTSCQLLHTCSRLDTSEMHTSRGELMDFVKSALLRGPPNTRKTDGYYIDRAHSTLPNIQHVRPIKLEPDFLYIHTLLVDTGSN